VSKHINNAIKGLIGKLIFDKNGRIVLIQLPNLPLAVFFVASISTRLLGGGAATDLLKTIAFGSIFTWAWLEIFAGANYFRRALGLVVLGLSIMGAVVFLQSLK
jgi:hypothetical protein